VLPCARRRRQIHKVLTAKSKANALKVKSGHFDPKDLASYERRNGVKVPAPAVLLFELVLRCQELHEPSAASVASAQRRICLSRTCLWSAAPLPARWRSRVHAHTHTRTRTRHQVLDMVDITWGVAAYLSNGQSVAGDLLIGPPPPLPLPLPL